MRWSKPREDSERTIEKFAIFPIEIDNEIRWLEFVKIRQFYCCGSWINMRFVDNS